MKSKKETPPKSKLEKLKINLDFMLKELEEEGKSYNAMDRIAGFFDRFFDGKSSSKNYKKEIEFIRQIKNKVDSLEIEKVNEVSFQEIATEIHDCELQFPHHIGRKLFQLKFFLFPNLLQKNVEMTKPSKPKQ